MAKANRHEVRILSARRKREHTWYHKAWLLRASTVPLAGETGSIRQLMSALTGPTMSVSESQRSLHFAEGKVNVNGWRVPSSANKAPLKLPPACRRSAIMINRYPACGPRTPEKLDPSGNSEAADFGSAKR